MGQVMSISTLSRVSYCHMTKRTGAEPTQNVNDLLVRCPECGTRFLEETAMKSHRTASH